ncbi:hypothetical protein [Siphonobacter sp. SORGH_AS_1065]|uniref:hypothetical protein n=1 Tax=Siphonobacter sp. SORGH_AS_1065 TaxID=3041795 RepID=UPI00278134F3|nr:hypothetical protein [Siphonobacter sp. SORGH_AS_1065]MDQ1087781.1 cytoskeletal protein RodZ [Siphonobacter sp. SORGH_AS_1065]
MKNDPLNMPDDQLDDLFRKAASGFEPPFDPEAWKRMEQKLDGDQYFQTKLKRFTLIEGIVILIMVGLFWLTTGRSVTQLDQQTLLEHQEKPTPPTHSTLPSSSRNPLPKSLNVIPGSQEHAQEANERLPELNSNASSALAEQPVTSAKKAKISQKSIPRKQVLHEPFYPITAQKKSGQQRSVSDTILLNSTPATIHSELSSDSHVTSIDTLATLALSRLKPSKWQKLPVNLSWQTPDLASAPEIPIQPLVSRWALQLLLSPDFTQVPGRQAATGYNTGLQLEYRFAPRWRASAGVIYSLKNYSASSYDYRPYQGYWATYKRPDVIDAACRMLDVPLTITYDAWKWKQNQFFVSLGSTSYLMLKEDYYYQYPTYTYELEKKRTGNHWLATANISLGLERPILPRLLVRIEPFVKTPLGGVGFGKVRLRSSGVFFSLRYQLKKH